PTSLTPIYQTRGGTSMAAPHVAGAIATLKEAQPNATVPQIITALTTSGPNLTDQRSGGFVTKRRLNTWTSLCNLITCDSDDFRTIGANQTLNGVINPAGDVDHYYYFGTVGQRLTIRMNRTSGSHDPYIELLSPSGFRVAFNDNGGGGVNALINGYLLPQSGMYQLRVRSMNNATGNYQIITSTQAEPLNPAPQISHFSPTSTAGSFFGSDFWVAIYGNNFTPATQVRWNGNLRAKFYSSSTLIYIRVLGGDISLPWPRNAFISVENPTPGGGSVTRAFLIRDPFLGESKLLTPASGSSVSAGISHTFAISWTAPLTTTTWRDMQAMDLRLRNEEGEIAAWVRVVERANDQGGSFYRLLNASEEIIGEGLPGEAVSLVLTDTVTLDLATSQFTGSGLTAIMTPTLTFGPAAIGTYNVEFRVDTKSGEDDDPKVQEDVLGTFTVLPTGCEVAIADVSLTGATTGLVDEVLVYNAAVSPLNASLPITYTWTPEPATGQGFPNAAFRFAEAGTYLVSVQVENCGAFAGGIQPVQISSGATPELTITKRGPVTAVPTEPFTYTLTIVNQGAMTATNLLVRDRLPTGATYIAGGAQVGDEVQWQIPALAGYGTTTVVTVTVQATEDLVNSDYRAEADDSVNAQGSITVTTRLVDAQILLTAVTTATLRYANEDQQSQIVVPGGAVFADTMLTYLERAAPPNLGELTYAGRAFRLAGYQEDRPVDDPRLYETITVSLSYDPAAIEGLDPATLTLRAWNGDRWQNDGISCTVESEAQQLDCTLATPLLTDYALVSAPTGGSRTVYLPLILDRAGRAGKTATITSISERDGQYSVVFVTFGFTAQLPGDHVHFFFDTVPPEEAGMPGSGPWYVYGGPSPFTGYGLADRPVGATQMCILVANPDHSVILRSGNCVDLP
ncbi:MAG: DUF11 domain-containing protein, partial [Chloroflexia bacterium]|nr:DUF11 domain-containing protein [Chloroflexia bacterium]